MVEGSTGQAQGGLAEHIRQLVHQPAQVRLHQRVRPVHSPAQQRLLVPRPALVQQQRYDIL